MEKRRAALFFLAALGLSASACEPPIRGARLESARTPIEAKRQEHESQLDLLSEKWDSGEGDRAAVLAIIYLIVAGSWIGFTAYVWLLKNVPTSKVATYAYVNPIVAVFLGWLVLHEKMDGWMFAGSVVIILSVVLVTGAKPKREEKQIELELPVVEGSGD